MSAEDISLQLPHALGPEKSILSSMLRDPERWIGRALEEGLRREDFYLPAHGLLYEQIAGLQDEGKEIELVSLPQLLHDRGLLDHIGGVAALSDIYTYAPNAAHFEMHLRIVRDKALLRRSIAAFTDAIGQAYESPEDPAAWLDQVESAVLGLRRERQAAGVLGAREGIQAVMRHFKAALEGEEDSRALSSGLPDLDRMTGGGFKPGEMIVIAARPSMGKTSLMMNLVEHACVDLHVPTLVFSAEMTAFQLLQRLAFGRARFALGSVKRGFRPDKATLERLRRAAKEIASASLWVDETPSLPIDQLRAKARRRKREDGIGLIAIDYLQLLRSGSRQAENSREREIGEISAGIKALAKELEVPVIVLAQLNRGPEGRTGKNLGVPRLSDLRESGTIEQDADLVGLLYRSAYYAEDPAEAEDLAGAAELLLAKNRNGETGPVYLTFLAELMKFEARAYENAER